LYIAGTDPLQLIVQRIHNMLN